MNLQQKKKLAKLAGYYYNRHVYKWTRDDDTFIDIEEFNALDHFDDILRGLSDDQKGALSIRIDANCNTSKSAVKVLWVLENKQKALELILEVLESEVRKS